jgi:hypothetical protein
MYYIYKNFAQNMYNSNKKEALIAKKAPRE